MRFEFEPRGIHLGLSFFYPRRTVAAATAAVAEVEPAAAELIQVWPPWWPDGEEERAIVIWVSWPHVQLFGPKDVDAVAAAAAGDDVYRTFRRIVEVTEPAYAGVGLEAVPPSNDALEDAEEGGLPDNVFISRAYAGEQGIADVQELFNDAYTEQWSAGIYISCECEFNPARVEVTVDRARRAALGRVLQAPPGVRA